MSETQDNLNLQIQEVLSELKQQRHEVSSLRDEVRGNSINVAAEVKRIKTEKDISWKFRGNRVQFEFNNELGDAVKQATWAMENGKEAYCKELINEISEKLKKRNKLIRIADTSPGGWDTVRLYEANPIASDSDDEAKIYKAENRALKRKKPAGRVKSATASRVVEGSSFIPPVFPPISPALRSNMQPSFQTRPFLGYQTGAQGYGASTVNRGPCFACGDFRHFRRNCPNTKQESGDQYQYGAKK